MKQNQKLLNVPSSMIQIGPVINLNVEKLSSDFTHAQTRFYRPSAFIYNHFKVTKIARASGDELKIWLHRNTPMCRFNRRILKRTWQKQIKDSTEDKEEKQNKAKQKEGVKRN